MDKKDTSMMIQQAGMTKIKENLDMSENMQRNGKKISHLHKEENTNTRAIEIMSKLGAYKSGEDMESKTVNKQKPIGKLVQP